jgi:hypothetical protein
MVLLSKQFAKFGGADVVIQLLEKREWFGCARLNDSVRRI